jgi:hypothetical protein
MMMNPAVTITKTSEELFSRFFTKGHNNELKHPYEKITWIKATAALSNMSGEKIYEATDLEFPNTWSQTAINIVASKYFYAPSEEKREKSLKQLIDRVVNTIADWGLKGNYFTKDETAIFKDELTYLLVHQMASFNSPVWFNCGIHQKPQCSACRAVGGGVERGGDCGCAGGGSYDPDPGSQAGERSPVVGWGGGRSRWPGWWRLMCSCDALRSHR